MIKCKCGCDLETSAKCGYYKGHWNKGRKRPDVVKRNKKNNPMKNPEISKRAGIKPENYIIWNKGLSQNTDIRVQLGTQNRNKNINKITKKISKTKRKNYKIGKTIPYWKGKQRTDEKFLEKMRIASINRVLKQGTNIAYNHTSIPFFNELNKKFNLKGKFGKNEVKVIGYSLDFYSKKYNLVIEWDERSHYPKGKLREKDKLRQKRITKHLSCKFIRIKEWLVNHFDYNKILKIITK